LKASAAISLKIVAVDPYPRNYDEDVEQARKELREEYRPKLKTKVENMESYDDKGRR
jgi:hypothetical protein